LIAPLLEPPQTPGARDDCPLQWAELAELLGRCERTLRDDLSRHALPLGLTQAQFSLMWACRQAPPDGLSQNELALSLALSPAHVSGQVEQLRAKGWLAGQRRAPDRRKQVWQLTSEGDARLQELLSALVTWAGQLNDQMCPERRQSLFALLDELASILALPVGGAESHDSSSLRTNK
jgi:DNA-binding MarR family transcriptional regulator